jgi:hypothetical protein
VIDQSGKLTLPFTLFFTGLYTGDTGTTFSPTAVGLTSVGTPTIVGAYFKDGQFYDFYIYIQPGTNTSSTSGTTYFELPFDVQQDGYCGAVTGTNASMGAVIASSNRCYPPSWATITTPITIQGRVLAK